MGGALLLLLAASAGIAGSLPGFVCFLLAMPVAGMLLAFKGFLSPKGIASALTLPLALFALVSASPEAPGQSGATVWLALVAGTFVVTWAAAALGRLRRTAVQSALRRK